MDLKGIGCYEKHVHIFSNFKFFENLVIFEKIWITQKNQQTEILEVIIFLNLLIIFFAKRPLFLFKNTLKMINRFIIKLWLSLLHKKLNCRQRGGCYGSLKRNFDFKVDNVVWTRNWPLLGLLLSVKKAEINGSVIAFLDTGHSNFFFDKLIIER